MLSFFTQPKTAEQLQGVIWTTSALGVLEHEREKCRGLRSLRLWWALMVLAIGSLYFVFFVFGSRVDVFEAENMGFTNSGSGAARLQQKTELADFNLWTGKGQLLFTPTESGDSITFNLPIEQEGRYELAALVTKGPDYGRFRISVNDRLLPITYSVTRAAEGSYQVVREQVSIFDDTIAPAGEQQPGGLRDSIAADHVVERLDLGELDLDKGNVPNTLTAVEVRPEQRLIGIDQWIVIRR